MTVVKITVKNQDVQKRQSFLVSWYRVSFVWVIAPSTLLIEIVLRETHYETCSNNVLSYYELPVPPQIKDRVFFVLLGGDWEEDTRKRAVTDGIFRSFLILMKLMFYGISFSKKVLHIREQLR